MSGNIVGGVIGAAIGFMVGNPMAGWMIGSTIGGLLFPPAGPDGPRLDDLRPQSSEYGRPIPITYGTVGIGGNVIWASDLIEVEGDSGGGKGGSESSTYSYFANFAVAVCEGERTIGRIWAGPEKRLIWDGATLEGEDAGALLRVYSGSETQLPDALMESYQGVGSVPAYRGTCYLVLENFPVANDGNRIPFLTVEVGAATAAQAAAANLGLVNIQQVIITASYYIIFYNGTTRGFMIRNLADETVLVQHYQYELGDWSNDADWFWDEDRDRLVRWSGGMTFDTVDPATGVFVSHAITAHASAGPDPNTAIVFGLYYQGNYIFMANGSATKRSTAYLIDPVTFAAVATYTYDMDATLQGPMFAPVSAGAYLWGCTNVSTIRKYPLSAAASTLAGPLAPSYSSVLPAVAAIDPVTGYIWSATDGTNVTTQYVACTDPETATDVYSATVTIDPPDYFGWGASTAATPWVFYSSGVDRYVALCGQATLASSVLGDYAIVFDADTPGYVSQGLGTASGGYHLNTVAWNPTTSTLIGFRKTGYLSEAGTPTNPLTFPAKATSFYLGEADSGGLSTASSEALSTIISDLSERAGLTAAQIDVTDLTDLVDGFAIANQTTVRDAITVLMPAYFFDAVESDGKVKFVTRGGATAVTIPDADVGCFEAGTEPPDPIETTRRMEHELPRTMNVRYLLVTTNYSPASRAAKRLVGSSGDEQTLDLPLVLSDTKAQEIAEVNLHGAWVARLTYSFTLPREYSYLEPTDNIVVYGFTMRLTKTVAADGIIKCQATHDDSNIYVPNVVVTETPAHPGTVATIAVTILELA